MPYKVFVDDNFHYMDESERYSSGEYSTQAKAIAKCRKIVDEDLRDMLRQGVAAEELHSTYIQFGEDPWVEGGGFSARDYARSQCDLHVKKAHTKRHTAWPFTWKNWFGGHNKD